jgi:hypothetical protein
MGRAVSEPRAISSLLAAGVAHKSGNVRFKAAAHLDGIVSSGSQAVRASLVANWTLLEKLFRAAAALLDEGSFGTRVHGKRLLWQLARLVGNRADVDRLLGQLRPEALMKRAQEVVAAPDCPAATPPSRGAIVGELPAGWLWLAGCGWLAVGMLVLLYVPTCGAESCSAGGGMCMAAWQGAGTGGCRWQ